VEGEIPNQIDGATQGPSTKVVLVRKNWFRPVTIGRSKKPEMCRSRLRGGRSGGAVEAEALGLLGVAGWGADYASILKFKVFRLTHKNGIEVNFTSILMSVFGFKEPSSKNLAVRLKRPRLSAVYF
jgi:hypothetical protein